MDRFRRVSLALVDRTYPGPPKAKTHSIQPALSVVIKMSTPSHLLNLISSTATYKYLTFPCWCHSIPSTSKQIEAAAAPAAAAAKSKPVFLHHRLLQS
jgi:hypothetical protein